MSLMLLGVLNSQVSGSAAVGAFDLLESVTLAGDAGSIDFINLASTYSADYKHLQFRMTGKMQGNTTLTYTFNNTDGASTQYGIRRYFSADYTTGTGSWSAGEYEGQIGPISGGSGVTATYGMIFTIYDAFSTSKYKTAVSRYGVTNSSLDRINGFYSNNWASNDAITSVKFDDDNGKNFLTGTTIHLYGMKA